MRLNKGFEHELGNHVFVRPRVAQGISFASSSLEIITAENIFKYNFVYKNVEWIMANLSEICF